MHKQRSSERNKENSAICSLWQKGKSKACNNIQLHGNEMQCKICCNIGQYIVIQCEVQFGTL